MTLISNGLGMNEAMTMYDVMALADLGTADFDPDDTGGAVKAKWLKSGFYLQADVDTTAYVIPFMDYYNNGYETTGLIPVSVYMPAGLWYQMPLAKVYAQDDASYATGTGNFIVGINN